MTNSRSLYSSFRLYCYLRRGGGGGASVKLFHGGHHHARDRHTRQLYRYCSSLRLLFSLAIYALPSFVGATAAFTIYHSGGGYIAAIVIGVLAGTITLTIGQASFQIVRSPALRGAIAIVFGVPAALAGYEASHAFAHMLVPSNVWSQFLSAIGALFIGGTAVMRLIRPAIQR
ncbi:hypothetical protein MHY1_02983 [Methylovirgula sp. HY1]|nr:hypothetical protein MHY1_02983 [Methylovirgula sp. HY1]